MTLHCIYPILLKFMYQTEQILILKCNNHGWQYFRVFAPFLLINLPACIRQTVFIVNYKKRLKYHLSVKHLGKRLLCLLLYTILISIITIHMLSFICCVELYLLLGNCLLFLVSNRNIL